MMYPINLHEDSFPFSCGLGMVLPDLVLSLRLYKSCVTCSLSPFPTPIPHGDWRRDLEAQKVKIMV